jgi:hypothetical protein
MSNLFQIEALSKLGLMLKINTQALHSLVTYAASLELT